MNSILNQPDRRRVLTECLNHVSSKLDVSLESEASLTPAVRTLPHSYPKTRFRGEREHKIVPCAFQLYVVFSCKVVIFSPTF